MSTDFKMCANVVLSFVILKKEKKKKRKKERKDSAASLAYDINFVDWNLLLSPSLRSLPQVMLPK